MYRLKLYITGRTPGTEGLVAELQEAFRKNCGGLYELEVLDLFENIETAHQDKILVTPTLIKSLPPPARRIVGDLSDIERVLAGLEIETVETPES